MERIDVDIALSEVAAYHKVHGQSDDIDLHTNPATDLHINDRERNRDANMLLQHDIEEAIVRIMVIVLVAVEVFFRKEYLIDGLNDRERIGAVWELWQ